jgi:serine O-acetyltransferase
MGNSVKCPPNPFCDLYRYVAGGGESKGVARVVQFLGTAVINYSWHACLVLRFAQWCHWLYLWPISFILQRVLLHLYGIDMPPSTQVGPGLWMPHALNIVIHRGSQIGRHVTIHHNATIGGRDYNGYPRIEDGAVLGVGSTVLGRISVGAGATVAAHALVLKSVPAGTTAVGVLAEAVARARADVSFDGR